MFDRSWKKTRKKEKNNSGNIPETTIKPFKKDFSLGVRDLGKLFEQIYLGKN